MKVWQVFGPIWPDTSPPSYTWWCKMSLKWWALWSDVTDDIESRLIVHNLVVNCFYGLCFVYVVRFLCIVFEYSNLPIWQTRHWIYWRTLSAWFRVLNRKANACIVNIILSWRILFCFGGIVTMNHSINLAFFEDRGRKVKFCFLNVVSV